MQFCIRAVEYSLFGVKIAAEIQGMRVRHIGTVQNLVQIAEAKRAETEETTVASADSEIATPPAAARNDSVDETAVETEEGLQWAGNETEENGLPRRFAPRNDSVEVAEEEDTGLQWAGSEIATPPVDMVDGTVTENNNIEMEEMTYEEQQEQSSGRDGARIGKHSGRRAGEDRKRGRARAAQRRSVESTQVRADVKNLGVKPTSLEKLGLSIGSDLEANWEVPRAAWNESIQTAADYAAEHGLKFVPVVGNMYVKIGDKLLRVEAAIENGVIYVQADSMTRDVIEVTLHEIFHHKIGGNKELQDRLVEYIQQNYDMEEVSELFDKYRKIYREFVKGMAPDKQAEYIWEEMLADAYAELERFPETEGPVQWSEYVRDAMEQAETKNTANGGVRMSADERPMYAEPITPDDVDVLRSAGRKSINAFSSEEINKAQKWAYRFYKAMGVKSPFFRAWFGEWREDSTDAVVHTIARPDAVLQNGKAKNTDTGIIMSWNAHDIIRETSIHAVKDKVSNDAVKQLAEIVENAVLLDTVVSVPSSKSKMKNTAFMHSFYSVYETGGETYVLKLYAELALSNNGDDVFTRAYQLKDIKKVAVLGNGVLGTNAPLSGANTATIESVADLVRIVKQWDPEYTPHLSGKVVNADGTPKVMYHGTSRGGFAVFNTYGSNFGLFGLGSYFTDDPEVALSYTKKGKGNNPEVYAVYLNIRNPIDMDAAAELGQWRKAFKAFDLDTSYLANVLTNEDAFRALKENLADEYYEKHEAADTVLSMLEHMGYDGITHMGGGRFDKNDPNRHRVYIAFNPEQIKSATDNIGTFDKEKPDIRFSVAAEQDLEDFADWTEEDLRQHIETMDSAENVEYNEMERAAAEAARNFQINFTGEIRKGKSVSLSRTEVEAIRHALKSGYGHIEADGERGYVNTWENCYIFEIADGSAVIKYVVGHEENNIHRRKYEEEYGHVGRRRSDWKTGTQTKVERNGQDIGAGDISSASRIGESGVSDGMDGRASGSDTDGNLEEIERDREDRDSISALSKRARDLSYLLKVEHRFTQEDKRLIRKEIKRLREKIREKMPRFSVATEPDLEDFADWTEEVLGRRMTPEEFAASMEASKSRPPQGRIKEIVDGMNEKYEHTARDGHLYKNPNMSDEEYAALDEKWQTRTRPQPERPETAEQWIIPKKRFTSTPAMEKLGIKIDGSVTRYRQTEQMRAYERAAKHAEYMVNARFKALNVCKKKLEPEQFAGADRVSDVQYRSKNLHSKCCAGSRFFLLSITPRYGGRRCIGERNIHDPDW